LIATSTTTMIPMMVKMLRMRWLLSGLRRVRGVPAAFRCRAPARGGSVSALLQGAVRGV
jgi:hypothetical protein